jgi:hypothetical protein
VDPASRKLSLLRSCNQPAVGYSEGVILTLEWSYDSQHVAVLMDKQDRDGEARSSLIWIVPATEAAAQLHPESGSTTLYVAQSNALAWTVDNRHIFACGQGQHLVRSSALSSTVAMPVCTSAPSSTCNRLLPCLSD